MAYESAYWKAGDGYEVRRKNRKFELGHKFRDGAVVEDCVREDGAYSILVKLKGGSNGLESN